MGIVNKSIPRIYRDNIGNIKVEHSPIPEEVIIDDAFDPLFNAKAREYLTNKYGGPVVGTLGGFAEMWENALAPKENKWGKLGPAMGVLGTFGRTIDKAEDFLLGGITEGVNALNYINPLGTREVKPSNPLENIFVKDEDYSGQRLFAAMANSMSKLAGGTTLNEEDFTGTWAIPSIEAELITDPGIAGGALARAYSPTAKAMSSSEILNRLRNSQAIDGTTLGDVSQLLSNYDDLLAKGAWDVTLPGFRPLVKNTFGKILRLVGASDKGEYVDAYLGEVPVKGDNLSSPPVDPTSIPFEQAKTFNYTNTVKDAMKNFQGMQLDTTNDVLFNQIVDDLVKEYPQILEDPDLVNDINKIKATIEARDLVMTGPNTKQFLKAQKDYANAMKELDDLKALHLDDPDFDYSDAYTKLDEIRQNAIKEGRKFYFTNSDIFDKYLAKSNENLDSAQKAISENAIKRNESYNEQLNKITRAFQQDMPNAPYDYHSRSNAYINKLLKDKPDLLNDFKSTYKNEATSDMVGNTITYQKYSKEIADRYQKLSEANFKKYSDDIAEDLRISLERQADLEASPETFINKILNGEIGEYPENIVHKKNLEKYLGLDKAYSGDLKSPIFFSMSTKRFRTDTIQDSLVYARERIRKAILETPNAWHSKNAKDYINTLGIEPSIREAINSLNYEDASGKLHKYGSERLNFLLDRIMTQKNGKYTMDDIEKLLEAYTGYTNKKTGMHVEGLLDILDRIEKNSKYSLGSTSLGPLLDASKDIRKVLNEMKIASTEDFIAKPINEALNSYTRANPTYFVDPTTKAIDLNKVRLYTEIAPDFEVQIDKELVLKHGLIMNDEFVSPEVLQQASKKDKWFLSKYLNYARNNSKNVIPEIIKGKTIVQSLDDIRSQTAKKLSTTFRTDIDDTISKLLPDEVYSANFDNLSQYNKNIYADLDKELLVSYMKDPASPPSPDNLTSEGKYMYDLLEEHKAVRARNARGDLASLRDTDVENCINDAEKVGSKLTYKQKGMYAATKDLMRDDIIRKDKLLNDVILSRGFTIGALPKNAKINEFDTARKAIEHNIKATTIKLNDGTELPLFKMIEFEDDVNNYVGLCLNTDPKVVKNIKKFNFNDIQDIVFHKGRADDPKLIEAISHYKELDEIYNRAETISANMMKRLGFGDDITENYSKHALIFGEGNSRRVKWLDDNIYSRINAEDLDNMSNILANELNLKGVFGTQNMTRSLRGNIASWNANANIFSYEPDYVLKSQFSTGIYANQDVQTFTDLFINDNFKLSTYKLDKNRLKDILGLKDSYGRLGNANNLELIAPVYDKETGRLLKFKRFDKLSETGIEQALKNPDTILVPTWSIAPLDKMLRKDAKMSNKVYAAFNKYLNIPFKFGTLINPGFLIGNANDALMKQATTMSTKYGTSFAEELANAAVAVKQAIQINNNFTDNVWTKYLADNAEVIEKQPYLKIMGNMPESVASRKHFMDWFNAKRPILTDKEIAITRLWMYINSSQVTTAFRDFDIDDAAKINKFDVAHPVEDALKKVTVGNRLGKKVLDTSEGIESLARSSSVLNDLTHKYSIDEIERIIDPQYMYEWKDGKRLIKNGSYKTSKEFKELEVNIQNAINAMNNANFDYNNMPDFVDFMSTFIPFPTFYLKNMSYWVDVAVNNPEYIDTAITIQDNAWRDRQKELKSDKFAAEAKGRGAIPLDSISSIGRISSKLPNPLSSVTPQIKGIFKPTPLNSMFGAFNSLQNPVKDLGQRIHPALSPITHHLLEDEDVKYRPYSSNPYEKNIKKGDPNFSMLKYTFHRLNPYERAINTGLRTPNKLKEGTAQLYDFAPSVFQPDFSKKSTKNKK